MEYLQPFQLLVSAIRKEIGWTWPFFLLGCLLKANTIFRQTHWSTLPSSDSEARHVKGLALFPAIYLKLVARFGCQTALEKYQRITADFGLALEKQAFTSYGISNLIGIERFIAFRKRMEQTAADRFNVREYLEVDGTTCHYILKRCVAHDFFLEAGTPELTRFFCRGDELFFSTAFPDLAFTRGDSWENTMAYGKDHCEYILKVKEPG